MKKKKDYAKELIIISDPAEVWKELRQKSKRGNPYFASNKGRIYSATHKKILNPDKTRYYRIKINGIHYTVHRLIAQCYCYGEAPDKVIHHIDGNRENNNANNLCWLTETQHKIIHAQIGKRKKIKASQSKPERRVA